MCYWLPPAQHGNVHKAKYTRFQPEPHQDHTRAGSGVRSDDAPTAPMLAASKPGGGGCTMPPKLMWPLSPPGSRRSGAAVGDITSSESAVSARSGVWPGLGLGPGSGGLAAAASPGVGSGALADGGMRIRAAAKAASVGVTGASEAALAGAWRHAVRQTG